MNKKKIVITGAPGTIGRRLTLRLLAAGYNVQSIDLKPWPDAPCPHFVVDLTDFGETCEALSGADTVIHLAAVRHNKVYTAAKTFTLNVNTAFHVFWAARLVGVRRVLWASSTHAAGQPYTAAVMPKMIPVTETDDLSCGDSYGISKTAIESILKHSRIWEGIEIAALRIGFAYENEDYEFLYSVDCPRIFGDIEQRLNNLWGYVDGRDVFEGFRLAIESEKNLSGEIIHIIAADTFSNVPTRELVKRFSPGSQVAADLPEFGGFYSTAHAEKVLGFKPKHSWREFVTA